MTAFYHLGPRVGISLEHLQGLIPCNRGDLHGVETLLKEPEGRLMPQVAEGEASARQR